MPSAAWYSRKSPRACSTCSGPAARTIAITSRGLEVPEAQLLPARAHARLVLGRRPHRAREALAPPLPPPGEPPRARGVDQHPAPERAEERRGGAVLGRRARGVRR